MRPPTANTALRSQRGSASVFLVCFAVALIGVAGLVYDGGLALVAKRRAINVAEQAARAGAQELSIASIRGSGPVRLDRPAASRSARSYLAAAGYTGSVRVSGNTVEVTVAWSRPAEIMSVVGVGGFGGTGHATAVNCRGVVREEEC
jgi:Flp pilus assembly protein TadG